MTFCSQNDPDLQNAFKGMVRTYWLVEVDGMETDTDSVQTEAEEAPHERAAGERASAGQIQSNPYSFSFQWQYVFLLCWIQSRDVILLR